MDIFCCHVVPITSKENKFRTTWISKFNENGQKGNLIINLPFFFNVLLWVNELKKMSHIEN